MRKPPQFIGIDIGVSQIKIASLEPSKGNYIIKKLITEDTEDTGDTENRTFNWKVWGAAATFVTAAIVTTAVIIMKKRGSKKFKLVILQLIYICFKCSFSHNRVLP